MNPIEETLRTWPNRHIVRLLEWVDNGNVLLCPSGTRYLDTTLDGRPSG